ncbi:MAG: GntR family transcriptional regulator [bacterium]|nr:GntR family transcriptional regulator [bacterium]
MAWTLDEDRPIYAQLIDEIRMRIIAGIYAPGDKLPSVRDLASEAAVNPNTMQKALSELERSGLVSTIRTSGRMVTEDKNMIDEMKNKLAIEQITLFFEKMQQFGFSREETAEFIQKAVKGEIS